MGQISYQRPIVEVGPCHWGGKFSYDGHEIKDLRWQVRVFPECVHQRRFGFLWEIDKCDRPRVRLLTSALEYKHERSGWPDEHYVFKVGATRPPDPIGDDSVILTFAWYMWSYLSTDQVKPLMLDVGLDGFFIGHGEAHAATVPNDFGSFQVEVHCRKARMEKSTNCEPECKLLNQLP